VHITVFSTLGHRWLASTRSSRRGRPETGMGGLLLPRSALLILPRGTRWEAPAAAPLVLPRVCQRREALAIAAPLLLPHTRRRLHRTTWWRCGWWLLLLYACRWLLLLLRHAWRLLLLLPPHVWRSRPMAPPRTPRATTMSAPTAKR
jgi:hypothetical protein